MNASRIALLIAGVEVPADMHAAHHCDNPPCVNPAHLYVATGSQNQRDRYVRNRGNQRDPVTGRFLAKVS